MKEEDPLGQALVDFYKGDHLSELYVFSEQFDTDLMPVGVFFREWEEMPGIEKTALKEVKGKILDIGAGAGAHALILQQWGYQVDALEISEGACAIMKKRGVKSIIRENFFLLDTTQKYDTLLFLMNGIGIAGKIDNLSGFFKKCDELLMPDGIILFDSSDLIYLFEEGELVPFSNYYGEINFHFEYRSLKGKDFNWLYIDPETLAFHAQENGFTFELIQHDEHYGYLGKMCRLA